MKTSAFYKFPRYANFDSLNAANCFQLCKHCTRVLNLMLNIRF